MELWAGISRHDMPLKLNTCHWKLMVGWWIFLWGCHLLMVSFRVHRIVVSRYTFQDVRLRGELKSVIGVNWFFLFYLLGVWRCFLAEFQPIFSYSNFNMSFHWTYPPWKINMTIEKQPFEKSEDVLYLLLKMVKIHSHVSFRRCILSHGMSR